MNNSREFPKIMKIYQEQIKRVINLLESNKVKISEGMSQSQIDAAQNLYEIVFPPDLKELIMTFIPEGDRFWNWADFSTENVEKIKGMLMWPADGALFDVEHNDFWPKAWGQKPDNLTQKLGAARKHLEEVPKLLPIYSHRFISSFPNEAGNPVFSVYQTDIIIYGRDLWDYFEIEYREKDYSNIEFDKIKAIPFWNDIIIDNNS